jgi:hypothetical protein
MYNLLVIHSIAMDIGRRMFFSRTIVAVANGDVNDKEKT